MADHVTKLNIKPPSAGTTTQPSSAPVQRQTSFPHPIFQREGVKVDGHRERFNALLASVAQKQK
jgi:hypothetical protein